MPVDVVILSLLTWKGTRSHTYIREEKEEEKNVKKEQITAWLPSARSLSPSLPLRSICRPTVARTRSLYLFPMSELFCQPLPALNNCSKWKEKENKTKEEDDVGDDDDDQAHVCTSALRTSFILRVCNTNSRAEEEEATAASTFYVTWKANKNNNNNNRCVKYNISTMAHCACFRERALALRCLYFPSTLFFPPSFLLLLSSRRPRNDSTAANAKEQKMENILRLLLVLLLALSYSPLLVPSSFSLRVVAAAVMRRLQNTQMKQIEGEERKRKENRRRWIPRQHCIDTTLFPLALCSQLNGSIKVSKSTLLFNTTKQRREENFPFS